MLCGFLFLATTLNYLDRQVLGFHSQPTMQRELGLDITRRWGRCSRTFYHTYTLAQFAVGPVLDGVNLRMAYGLAVFVVVAGWGRWRRRRGVLVAGVQVWGWGGGSANWPAAMRMVAQVFAAGEAEALGQWHLSRRGRSIGR
ncbi:MAG: hypothetical protein IPJ98_24465 [Bryobacterales bacterium]|nr:hypothetical protein [Bryobacterales bacterium]